MLAFIFILSKNMNFSNGNKKSPLLAFRLRRNKDKKFTPPFYEKSGAVGEPAQRARQQELLPIGGTFWTKFEPFLTKIRIATFNCRPAGGNPTQRFRSPDR